MSQTRTKVELKIGLDYKAGGERHRSTESKERRRMDMNTPGKFENMIAPTTNLERK